MIKFSKRAVLINAALGSLILAGAFSFVHKTFARPDVPGCESRYQRALYLSLQHDGVPITAADLQGMANGQDEGVVENLTIARFKSGPAPLAMGVHMPAGSGGSRSAEGLAGGISLPWIPASMGRPKSACLSYDVFLPSDFDFDDGGTLPGLYASPEGAGYFDIPRVSANFSWRNAGAPRLYIDLKEPASTTAQAFSTYLGKLPRGKWIHVDQEMVLNTPGKQDGAVRLWLDGRIETDVKTADLRRQDDIAITGVTGEVYYGGSGTNGQAKADTTIWLSPFQVRWN